MEKIDFSKLSDSEVILKYCYLLTKMCLFNTDDGRNLALEKEWRRVNALTRAISNEAQKIRDMGLEQL